VYFYLLVHIIKLLFIEYKTLKTPRTLSQNKFAR
jgi:hypothetical protein